MLRRILASLVIRDGRLSFNRLPRPIDHRRVAVPAIGSPLLHPRDPIRVAVLGASIIAGPMFAPLECLAVGIDRLSGLREGHFDHYGRTLIAQIPPSAVIRFLLDIHDSFGRHDGFSRGAIIHYSAPRASGAREFSGRTPHAPREEVFTRSVKTTLSPLGRGVEKALARRATGQGWLSSAGGFPPAIPGLPIERERIEEAEQFAGARIGRPSSRR